MDPSQSVDLDELKDIMINDGELIIPFKYFMKPLWLTPQTELEILVNQQALKHPTEIHAYDVIKLINYNALTLGNYPRIDVVISEDQMNAAIRKIEWAPLYEIKTIIEKIDPFTLTFSLEIKKEAPLTTTEIETVQRLS